MTDLDRLKTLLDSGRVKLGVNIRKMNTPGSPVYNMAENVWPAATILVGSFLGTALIHFYVGAAILAVGCWWWLTRVHPRIKDGVFERTAAMALASEHQMDIMWGTGALTLYAKLDDGSEMAATPRDNWRLFVQRLIPPTGTEGETG